MSDPRFLQEGFEAQANHVVEEIGEALGPIGDLLAALGKTGRWGRKSVNPLLPPEQQEANEAWLRRALSAAKPEIDDVLQAIARLQSTMGDGETTAAEIKVEPHRITLTDAAKDAVVAEIALADGLRERLARTPYLVVPRLAIEAMPDHWQARLEGLLQEGDAAGLDTPSYHVFRQGPAFTFVERSDSTDPVSPVTSCSHLQPDPWADYRRGDIRALCPDFEVAGSNGLRA